MSEQNHSAVLQRLIEGRARVQAGWCKDKTRIDGAAGPRYCARGAVMVDGTWDGHDDIAKEAEAVLASVLPIPRKKYGAEWVAHFNNNGNQAVVIALFDRAIAKAEGVEAGGEQVLRPSSDGANP